MPESDTGVTVGKEIVNISLKSERLILLTITLGIVLAPINSTMIAVALPDIMVEFAVGIGSASWLVTAYLIAMASLQPLAGKLGDRFGHRRLVLSGLFVFGFASVAAALAPSLSLLLVFRCLQAICAALIVPNGSALIREILPEHRRGARFGLMGAGIAIAAAAGPPLGGFLVEAAGWRAIFVVNILFVVPALLLGLKCLPPVNIIRARLPFDTYGAVLLPVLLIATAWTLISFSKGTTSLMVLAIGGLLILGIAAALGWSERRHPDPIVPLEFFARRAFSAAAAGIGFGNLAMYSLLVSLPLLLTSRNDSSLKIGLTLTTMSAGMTISSFAGGRMIDKFGRRLPTTAGLVLLAIGIIPLALSGADVAVAPLLGGLSLVGLGLGLATPGLQTSAVEAVERGQSGSASGLYSTSRYLGSILGSAVIAGILGTDKSGASSIGLVFVLSLAAAVLASLASLGLSNRPSKGT